MVVSATSMSQPLPAATNLQKSTASTSLNSKTSAVSDADKTLLPVFSLFSEHQTIKAHILSRRITEQDRNFDRALLSEDARIALSAVEEEAVRVREIQRQLIQIKNAIAESEDPRSGENPG